MSDAKKIVLNVNGIEVIYNHVILVLKGVSLQVPEGGIVAILGGNGAGKTTTLRAVSNLLAGERGEVTKGSSCAASASRTCRRRTWCNAAWSRSWKGGTALPT
jgi:ABC-type branched-subunit amino acid transport system ATPase component